VTLAPLPDGARSHYLKRRDRAHSNRPGRCWHPAVAFP
jgi:hypothetical protein